MSVNRLKLSIKVISDPRRISEIEQEFDAFIIKNSRNPFMLSAFVKGKMELALRKNEVPLVLVLMTDGKIIGVAPIVLRKQFGIRFANMLLDFVSSPDFIFDLEHGEVCMWRSLDFVFGHLGCRFAILDFPAESMNLHILERICKTRSMGVRMKNGAGMSHSVIPVECAWNDFQKSRGGDFRRDFKSIRRHLDGAGKWQILLFENENDEQGVFRKIMDVEEASWKQNLRLQHHMGSMDEGLLFIWEASSLAIRRCPDFKRSVWFLELNGQAIAYSLVIQYKGTAYMMKTSYNNQYRRLYPGIYVNNEAIRDLFNCGRIRMIDFMTNLPAMRTWTFRRLLRFRLSLWREFLPNLFALAIRQRLIRNIMSYLIPELVSQLA
jgi:hypothetical protein